MPYPVTRGEFVAACVEFVELHNRAPNIAICPWPVLEAVARWLDPKSPAPLLQIGKTTCGVTLLLGPVFRVAYIEPMKPDESKKRWP